MKLIPLKESDFPAALAALYNASKPQGLGMLHYTPEDMTPEEAAEILSRGNSIDYLKGRVIKVNFKEPGIYPALYDRDNGQGAAEAALIKEGVIPADWEEKTND